MKDIYDDNDDNDDDVDSGGDDNGCNVSNFYINCDDYKDDNSDAEYI